MGTPRWANDPHRTKRSRKYSDHAVPLDLAEARWKCQTCDGVIASDEDIYCMHCKMYWKDVEEGLFDFEDNYTGGNIDVYAEQDSSWDD